MLDMVPDQLTLLALAHDADTCGAILKSQTPPAGKGVAVAGTLVAVGEGGTGVEEGSGVDEGGTGVDVDGACVDGG